MASRSSFENRAFFDYEQYFFVGTEPIPAFYSAVNSSYYTFRKNEFVLRYNNGKVTQLNGHVEWSHASTARVWIDAVYQQFDLENAYKPLYQPKVRASFGASYRWKQRYKPWITVNYVGKRWASKQSFGLYSGLYQMDAYWDVNLGMDYQMNKQSMVFFRVTNLFNKQYFRFNNYPVAGLEIMLGIRYKF
jgi:outer membrane cobalamin receptor